MRIRQRQARNIVTGTIARLTLAASSLVIAQGAAAQAELRADQRAFVELYRELVETNTVANVGSCTKAAEQVARRMKAGGFRDSELVVFVPPGHPKDGGLVATLAGTDPQAKPMLLLAHIDVVEAKRDDWVRDPFKLIEQDGYFYGRGTIDDKSHAAIWADTLIRLRQEGFSPKRTIKMALTCGEETDAAANGAKYLAEQRPELISAQFAFNEGGGGRTNAEGKRVMLTLQVGEKASHNFTLLATNPGGHSSQPTVDNAIYELSDALRAVRDYKFPVKFTDTTRISLTRTAATASPETADAIRHILANPKDAEADAWLSRNKVLNSTLRTTCVATLLRGGHAENALPQRATANVNCRIFPGETVEQTLAELRRVAGPKVKVTSNGPVRPIAVPPPLDAPLLNAIEELAAKHFPGVPVAPTMTTAATDAVFMGIANIPVYGVPGLFIEADNGMHGLDERIRVQSLMDGRDYLFDLVKLVSTRTW